MTALGTLAAMTPPAAAQSQAELAPDVITVDGRGWGHGTGMSQWGALGYAIDHRWSSEQIISHYYGSTSHGPTSISDVPVSDVWVHLIDNNQRDLLLTSGAAFEVAGQSFDAGEIARIGVSGGTFWVRSTSGCAQNGRLVDGSLASLTRRGDRYVEASPKAGDYKAGDYKADDVSEMLTVIYCGASGVEPRRVSYRGTVGIVNQKGPYTFNRLPVEQYLRGVVPHESDPAWGSLGEGRGIEALEAQAIAARSYVLALAARRSLAGNFTDTCDTTACQVYEGAALNGTPIDHGAKYVHTNTAVLNTEGKVVRRADGVIALTEYHATSGGWTAGLDEGSRFNGVEDRGDDVDINRRHTWQRRLRRADIEAAFPQIGQLVCLEVTKRNGNGPWGGRSRGVKLVGTEGVWEETWNRWTKDLFRKALLLWSDWYRFAQFDQSGPCPDGPVGAVGTDSSIPATIGFGLWVLKSDGTVFADGVAAYLGNGSPSSSGSFTAMAAHPDGDGYWLATSGGDVQTFGSAKHHGDATAVSKTESIVAMAAHPDGDGYWLASGRGEVFAFGQAGHWGAIAHLQLEAEVVDIEASPTGDGYWLALDDGRVLAFGDAPQLGCGPLLLTDEASVGLAVGPDGDGYWLAGADTAVHAVGAVDHHGDRAALQNRLRVVAIAATATGDGYWLVWSDGTSFNYGDAPDYSTSRAGVGVVAASSVW